MASSKLTHSEAQAAVAGGLLVILVAAWLLLGPLAIIWSANVLGASVPYTWRTFLAVTLLGFFVRGSRLRRS